MVKKKTAPKKEERFHFCLIQSDDYECLHYGTGTMEEIKNKCLMAIEENDSDMEDCLLFIGKSYNLKSSDIELKERK